MDRERGTRESSGGDSDRNRSARLTARGYYGWALREGRVRKAQPQDLRVFNTLLWCLNVLIGLLLAAFIGWRVYTVYIVGNA